MKYGWGKGIVESISKDLRLEFHGINGFSAQNLWRMRQFYLAFSGNAKLSPLVREIGWSHNVIILMNCKDDVDREFYILMTQKYGWSKNVLINHIENGTYVFFDSPRNLFRGPSFFEFFMYVFANCFIFQSLSFRRKPFSFHGI